MRRTIKNKTQLRQIIKDSIGNTGSLDAIEFYNDFDWSVMDVNTWSNGYVFRCRMYDMTTEWDYYSSIDNNITTTFKKIERFICDCIDGDTNQELCLINY